MYAVIETGGKQYKVSPGDVIDVEHLPSAETGKNKIDFGRVLMVNDDKQVRFGSPLVEGVSVKGTLVAEVRAPKIVVFKMKRRKGYRRLRGHRQDLHRIRIESIKG